MIRPTQAFKPFNFIQPIKSKPASAQGRTSAAALAAIADSLPPIDRKVFQAIKSQPGIARFELAPATGLRLSTVCGAVNRIAKRDLIAVVGTKLDPETQRTVETLGVK